VLLHALSLARPQDCAHFASTSKSTNNLCATDILWRNLHSSLLDPPLQLPPTSSDQPHRELVKRYVEATTLLEQLQSDESSPSSEKLLPLLETLVHLAQSRPLAGIDSLNQQFLERYLSPTTSNILTLHPSFSRQPKLRSQSKQSPENVRIAELVSHLHALSTPSLLAVSSPSIRTTAREIVYERLNFTKSSSYGPLNSNGNGRIDYRKVEAIAVLMSASLEDAKSMGWGLENDADSTEMPSGWDSTRTGSAAPLDDVKVDPRDWAGVTTHEWRGTYSFLHYPIYHNFNAHRTSSYIPSLAEENEAVGDCMSLKLELIPEGEEMVPPMVAFGQGTARDRENERRAVDSDDDEDDEDFDDELEVVTDSDSLHSSDEEDGFNTHFVTNNTRQDPSNSQNPRDQDETPPTSPQLDESSPSPPIGPLPPLSSNTSTSIPSTSATTYPKLSFQGSSLPLQLRTLSFTGTFLNSQNQSHFNPRDRSIRGTVEMNDAGEIIWKYIIRYGGRDQWAM